VRRSRTSSTPGSALIPIAAAMAITANSAARRAIARTSTPVSFVVSVTLCAGGGGGPSLGVQFVWRCGDGVA
jgi:hypothetical protein